MLLYGEPRLTRDIDVTLGVDVDRLTELVALLAELRLNPLVEPESFTRRTMVLPCVDPDTDIRVDFIFSFTPYERAPSAEPLPSASAAPRCALPRSKISSCTRSSQAARVISKTSKGSS